MKNNQVISALITLGIILFLISLIPADVFKLVVFIGFSVLLTYCIIKLRNVTSLWGLIGYLAGVALSIGVTVKLIKYFAENYIWVSIIIAIVMGIVGLSFIIFMGILLVKGIYNLFKKRDETIN